MAPWFHNPETGQTFEADGVWEGYARKEGYPEVDTPEAISDDDSEATTEVVGKGKKKAG
ncbi:MAG: hypothetical protein ABIR47_07450 [Candidatus Kapaibacterium sp.]